MMWLDWQAGLVAMALAGAIAVVVRLLRPFLDHLEARLVGRREGRVWPAPPFPALSEWEPVHPVAADPPLKAMVIARGTEGELRDRVQVPPLRPAPFLDLPVEACASRSLLERMLSARGRW